MELNQLTSKIVRDSLFAIVLCAAVTVHAEDGGRGRLPDGSAYRTDSDGIQLVDHVAELEVTVEEMKRQLEAAQNEIRHQEAIVASLQGGAAPADAAESGKMPVCPPQPQLICPEPERSVEEVESEMKKVVKQNETEKEKAIKESARLAKSIESKDSELSLLRAKLKVADEQIAYYKTLNSGSAGESPRASVSLSKPSSTGSLALAPQQPDAKDENRVREQTLDSYRKNVLTELNQTRELMQQRDQLFAQYSASGKALKIKPSSAASSQNRTVEQLQKEIKDESSLRMLGLLAREVKEINEKVADDIELVKRLNH